MNKSFSLKVLVRNVAIAALLFAVGTVAVWGLILLGLPALIGFPIFILGIMIAGIECDSGVWSSLLGVSYLVGYDFLFTTPVFALKIFDVTDIVALAIFIVISLIMNSLTQRMRRQVVTAERNALVTSRLNKVSTGLINSTSVQGACECAEKELSHTLGRSVHIYYGRPDEPGWEGSATSSSKAALYCFEHAFPTGAGEPGWPDCTMKYLPLSTKDTMCGVIEVDCTDGDLDATSRSYLDSVIAQTAIATERNRLEDESQRKELEVERERFKTTLLRSVSHDLRTPLTSIAGNAELVKRNPDLDPATRDELLESISQDARWLSDMVENLLAMTRVEDGEVPIEKTPEIVEDIIGDAVGRMRPRQGKHVIEMRTGWEPLLVPMDGKLISQVLMNLIDNAIRHSRDNSRITISCKREGKFARFSVADNGGGIDPSSLDKIFDRFYTRGKTSAGRSSMGLGLSICKAIVEAHGGMISAYNNSEGGATFEFTLPLDEEGAVDEINAETNDTDHMPESGRRGVEAHDTGVHIQASRCENGTREAEKSAGSSSRVNTPEGTNRSAGANDAGRQ
jgi:two-component system sensor histidine kinase KdpD